MDTELKKAQKKAQDLSNEIQNQTIDEQVRRISQEATLIDEEVMQMAVKTNIDRATAQDKIDQIHAEMLGQFIQNRLNNATIGKVGMEIEQMKQNVMQK